MARSKSIPGSKPTRTKGAKEPAGAAAGSNVPDVKVGGETPAESAAAHDANLTATTKFSSETNPGSHGGPELKGNEGRKFEVVKSETRKNLVPINLEDEIRRRAYELYEQRGSGTGNEAEDWLTAEREVRQRYSQQSA